MNRIVLCAVLVFTSSQTTHQPTTQNKLGVVIESWHYDPQQKTLTLHLVNHSNKVVTAFNISWAVKYTDGSTNPWHAEGIPHNLQDSQTMEDELNLFITSERRGTGVIVAGPIVNGQIPRPPSVFAAGTTRDYVMPEQKDVADIEAVVDMVAYADGTADVQNDRAFKNLLAARKGPLLAMQKMTEVIKGVLADPMVSSPIAEVLRALRPLADAAQTKNQNRPPEDPEFFEARILRDEVKIFEMTQHSQVLSARNMTERQWLTGMVEQQEKRIALLAPHANLIRTQ
jgi:hypothetical protein